MTGDAAIPDVGIITHPDQLPVFDPWAPCPKCGVKRGLSEKGMWGYHDSRVPDARNQTCAIGGATEHLHVKCVWCQYEYAAAIAGEHPLTNEELRDVRELLRLAKQP